MVHMARRALIDGARQCKRCRAGGGGGGRWRRREARGLFTLGRFWPDLGPPPVAGGAEAARRLAPDLRRLAALGLRARRGRARRGAACRPAAAAATAAAAAASLS